MGKKILITGANGYIGRHVVKALCNLEADVYILDRHVDKVDCRARVLDYDIFSGSADIYHELGRPDACLHLAWSDAFLHSSDTHMTQLSQHYIFIRDMLAGGLPQLAVMGTMHELGYHEGAVYEDTCCNPMNLYGIAKDALRRSIFELARNKVICLQWLRAYYIYGDDQFSNSIFAKLLQAAERGEKTFPFTSGKNKYDFIHVDALAEQIAACMMQTKIDGIINCCTGNPITLAEKVQSFILEHHLDIKLQFGTFPDRPYDSPGIWGDVTKINKIMEDRNNNEG